MSQAGFVLRVRPDADCSGQFPYTIVLRPIPLPHKELRMY
jgi:hypothetical protein